MSDTSQEPVFFCEEHRKFLENNDANALKVEALRPYLYKLMTDHRDRGNKQNCADTVFAGTSTTICGVACITYLVFIGYEVVKYLVEHGFPHWRLIIYAFIMWGWLAIVCAAGAYICLVLIKDTMNRVRWRDGRIAKLVSQLAQEGTLIQGYLDPIEIGHYALGIVPYHFITESGEKAFGAFQPTPFLRVYYPDVEKKFPSGTPVWVLYLNDKISVLL